MLIFPRTKESSQQTFIGLEEFLKTSWKTKDCYAEDALKTSSMHLQRNSFSSSKRSWRRLGRRKVVTLKTSSRRLEDMSWRRLEDISWRRLEDMSWRRLQDVLETNKSKCVYLANLHLTNLYLTNLRRIQNALIRTQ